MRQRVSNPELRWWEGILLILVIVAILILFQFFAAAAALSIGGSESFAVASVAFWIFGGVIALGLIRLCVMKYDYVLEGLNLRVDRIYGRLKPRNAVTVITRSIVRVGDPEEIQAQYPGSHPRVYTRSRCPLSVTAVAYTEDGHVKVIHLQADDAMKERLLACVRKK